MKVTLLVEVETDEGMGFDAPEDVRSTLEDLVEDNIPSGFYVKIKVLSSEGVQPDTDEPEADPELAREYQQFLKNKGPCTPQPHCPHCDPS